METEAGVMRVRCEGEKVGRSGRHGEAVFLVAQNKRDLQHWKGGSTCRTDATRVGVDLLLRPRLDSLRERLLPCLFIAYQVCC